MMRRRGQGQGNIMGSDKIMDTFFADRWTVRDIFAKYYQLPYLQREYCWSHEQVTTLMVDLVESWEAQRPLPLGMSILTKKDVVFEITDGQQRMTSLWLLLIAVRERLACLDERMESVDGMLAGSYFDPVFHEDRAALRVEPRDRVLRAALEEVWQSGIPRRRPSRNDGLRYALWLLHRMLVERFGDNGAKLKAFCLFLFDEVFLVFLVSSDESLSYKLFEMNAVRGQPLAPYDMIKGLFYNIGGEAKEEAVNEVCQRIRAASDGDFTSMTRLLRYHLLCSHGAAPRGKMIAKKDLFRWFEGNIEALDIVSDPVGELEAIHGTALALKALLSGCLPDGSACESLAFMRALSAGDVIHLLPLLAVSGLPTCDIGQLAVAMERVAFVHMVCGTPPREAEGAVVSWVLELREISDTDGLEAFLRTRIQPYLEARAARVHAGILACADTVQSARRVRAIHARMAQYLEQRYGDPGARFADIRARPLDMIDPRSCSPSRENCGSLADMIKASTPAPQDVRLDLRLAHYANDAMVMPARFGAWASAQGNRMGIAPIWGGEVRAAYNAWLADLAVEIWCDNGASGASSTPRPGDDPVTQAPALKVV